MQWLPTVESICLLLDTLAQVAVLIKYSKLWHLSTWPPGRFRKVGGENQIKFFCLQKKAPGLHLGGTWSPEEAKISRGCCCGGKPRWAERQRVASRPAVPHPEARRGKLYLPDFSDSLTSFIRSCKTCFPDIVIK